ncbi:MAG: hypothetical protein F6K21_27775 [Symploca sp. SIO2D2]|nr:hypothetical protein [Symploca sp. SIO2D2]
MATVSILPIYNSSGEKTYRALAGNKHSVGKTAGQALDALTIQLEDAEFSSLLVIQSFNPDGFFSAKQQEQLSELMSLWRLAREQGRELLPEQQKELEELVEAELRAATARSAILLPEETL